MVGLVEKVSETSSDWLTEHEPCKNNSDWLSWALSVVFGRFAKVEKLGEPSDWLSAASVGGEREEP